MRNWSSNPRDEPELTHFAVKKLICERSEQRDLKVKTE
jgi:hypothetical protein